MKKPFHEVPGHPTVGVVIPAYNEERNIESVLAEVRAVAERFPNWWVVPIVVNDGSTDRTAWVLDRVREEYGAKVIHLPVNLGIGGAVQAGLQRAAELGADVALQLDGDGQHPAEEIPRLVEPILAGRADVVVGSRYVEGAGGNVSTGLREFGTRYFSVLLRWVAGVQVRDTTSGFRAFGPEALDFLARYYPDDYPEVETYVPLVRRGFRIVEIPVTMRKREGGVSSITPVRSLYYMVKVSFATVIDRVRNLPLRRELLPLAGRGIFKRKKKEQGRGL